MVYFRLVQGGWCKGVRLTCTMSAQKVRFMIEPQMASMAAEHATEDQIVCIRELCDESQRLAEAGEDYSAADTAFHNAIAESCGNLVVPRLMGVLKASVPLFIDVAGKKLVEETIRTQSHRRARRDVSAPGLQPQHDRGRRTGVKRVEGVAAISHNRSPYKSERSPNFKRIKGLYPPYLLY